MGMGIGKVLARMIFDGRKKFSEVPDKYKQDVIDAWYTLYGNHPMPQD